MAVSQGSYTVGSGGDYSDWNAAKSDVAAPLTGDLTFTQISDTIESVDVLFVNLNLGGFTLELTSDTPHNGDPDAGHRALMGAANFFGVQNCYNGTVKMYDMNIRANAVGRSDELVYLYNASTSGLLTILVYDNIFDSRSVTGVSSYHLVYMYSNSSVYAQPIKMFNCKVVHPTGNGRSGIYCATGQAVSELLIENTSVQNDPTAGTGCYGFQTNHANGSLILRNCVTTGFTLGGSDYGYYNGQSGAVAYNCMSEDGTATNPFTFAWGTQSGCIANITPANEFTSTDPDAGGLTYFEPKSTGQAAHDGDTTIQITENDHGANKTVDRPHTYLSADKVSIGPNEFPSEPTITTHPALVRVDENDPAQFSVVATDATGYQWQDAPPPAEGGSPTFSNMVGETGDTLTIDPAMSTLHQYQYRCVVSNAAGSVTSGAAYLLINGLPDPGAAPAAAPDPPTITGEDLSDLTLTLTIADQSDANVWRGQVTNGETGVLEQEVEIVTAGDMTLTLPGYDTNYVVVVQAGARSSPAAWSTPGYSQSFTVDTVYPAPAPSDPIDVTEEEPLYSDLDPDLRTDWQGNLLLVTDKDALASQLENAFGIEPGELVMQPFVGSDLEKIIGGNVSTAKGDFIRMVVSQTLADQDRLVIDRVQVEARPNDQEYRIFIEFHDRPTNLRGTLERFVGGER